MTMRLRIVLATLLVTVAAQDVKAEPFTILFTGQVTQRSGIVPVVAGDLVTGTIIFDTDRITTSDDGMGTRRYEGRADLRWLFVRPDSGTTVADYNLPDQRLDFVINNDVTDNPLDAYRPGVWADDISHIFGLALTDHTASALSSADLNQTVRLAAFDSRIFYGQFFNQAEQRILGTFDGFVTSLNGSQAPPPPSPVPEPASVVLFGSGLAAIAIRRLRRHQRSADL